MVSTHSGVLFFFVSSWILITLAPRIGAMDRLSRESRELSQVGMILPCEKGIYLVPGTF